MIRQTQYKMKKKHNKALTLSLLYQQSLCLQVQLLWWNPFIYAVFGGSQLFFFIVYIGMSKKFSAELLSINGDNILFIFEY